MTRYFIGFVVLVMVSPVFATSLVETNVATVSREAVEIYRVKVLSSNYEKRNASIWTSFRVQILENIKGDAASGEVVDLHLPGGVDGNQTVKISGLPQILTNHEYIVFLRDRVRSSAINRFADWSAYLVRRNSTDDRFVIAVGSHDSAGVMGRSSVQANRLPRLWHYDRFVEKIYSNLD